MKKLVWLATAVTAGLLLLLTLFYLWLGGALLQTLAVTAATTLYHLVMRLLVGYAVKAWFPVSVDPQGFWFRERSWEKGLYRLLRVRKWSRRVPTFSPEEFDARTHTYAQLAWQTCLSEAVHEIIVALGFLSLLFCLFFEDPLANLWPFLITAILAGGYDMQFVILQRANRPRLLRLAEREQKRRPCNPCEKNK